MYAEQLCRLSVATGGISSSYGVFHVLWLTKAHCSWSARFMLLTAWHHEYFDAA